MKTELSKWYPACCDTPELRAGYDSQVDADLEENGYGMEDYLTTNEEE